MGVIVKVEREGFKILDNNGNVQTVRLQEVGSKRNSRTAVAFDRNQNQIGVGDVLKVLDGPNKVFFIFKKPTQFVCSFVEK